MYGPCGYRWLMRTAKVDAYGLRMKCEEIDDVRLYG
ncbi:MAG: hypothetical protein ACI9TP_001458, partial [Candidatus Azotimanducaceae bacterium]